MRTKTLLLTALLGAASIGTSLAAVYSVNAVGYVNITVPAGGFALVGNPLNWPDGTNPTNTLDNLFPTAPNNTTKVWAFNGTTFALYTKRATGWSPAPVPPFNPGTGFFIENDATTNITLTFVGEVPQGTKTISYGTGYSLISSAFPLSGLVQTTLGLPAQNGDQVFQFDPGTQTYNIFTRRLTGWGGGLEPTIGTNSFANVAEGFFINALSAQSWTRSFDVNLP